MQLAFSAAVAAARLGRASILEMLTSSLGVEVPGAEELGDSSVCITCEPLGITHSNWAPHDCAESASLIHAAAAGGHEALVMDFIAKGVPADLPDSV